MHICVPPGPSIRGALERAVSGVDLAGVIGAEPVEGVPPEFRAEELYVHELAHIAAFREMGRRPGSHAPASRIVSQVAGTVQMLRSRAPAEVELNERLAIATSVVVLTRSDMLESAEAYAQGQAIAQDYTLGSVTGLLHTALVQRLARAVGRLARAGYGRDLHHRPIRLRRNP